MPAAIFSPFVDHHHQALPLAISNFSHVCMTSCLSNHPKHFEGPHPSSTLARASHWCGETEAATTKILLSDKCIQEKSKQARCVACCFIWFLSVYMIKMQNHRNDAEQF